MTTLFRVEPGFSRKVAVMSAIRQYDNALAEARRTELRLLDMANVTNIDEITLAEIRGMCLDGNMNIRDLKEYVEHRFAEYLA